MAAEPDDLRFERDRRVGTITFDRPAQRNALTFAMYESLAELCGRVLDGTLDIAALIITGAGDKAFAAGTDIAAFRHVRTAEQALDYERKMDRVLGTLETLPIPVIAAIRGACTGGGAAIAACCDLRVASADLRYGFPIARTLGNCLSVGNLSRLVELLGASRTREILLTSRLIGHEEALSIGLIQECSDDPLARSRELAEQLQGHAPLTMSASKEGLRRLRHQAADVDGDDLIERCYTSEDFREGVNAFLAKRRPEWTGR